MLHERITALFTLLQCTNTDIARYAGCSTGNISKLKSGYRVPRADSRSIQALARGVCRYADYENELSVLGELCGTEDTSPEKLIPALIAWLYGTDEITLPARPPEPKSKRTRAIQRHSFGERLDAAMTRMKISNRQLAALLNIDASLVSRYRSGIYSPHGNERLAEKLAEKLAELAGKTGRAEDLAALCAVEAKALDGDAVARWLYGGAAEAGDAAMARRLLQSLDDFPLGGGQAAPAPEVPAPEEQPVYRGTKGLREAVVRFLTQAAREGGELLLYSDEPMDWMSGDRAYFALWAALMKRCIASGVHIRIIHNVDREGPEMVDAIRGWLPLYVSGRIEPYVFRRERNTRFCHTVFLHVGHACIRGFFPAGSREDRWYDYVTEPAHLELLRREYSEMLAAATPFLRVYSPEQAEEYHALISERQGETGFLLQSLPLFTMPEGLPERMARRAGLRGKEKASILEFCARQRAFFRQLLDRGGVQLLLSLDGTVPEQASFPLELADRSLRYTPEDYASHLEATALLVERERNFHLTLLPEAPFREIQLVVRKDAVTVLRSHRPSGAFVFLNPTLTESVKAYFSLLMGEHPADRRSLAETLRGWKPEE